MIFRLLLIALLIVCIAWPLYKLILRCVLGVKTEFETEIDTELEHQARTLKEKRQRLSKQCSEDIETAAKKIKIAQKVKKSL